MKKQFLVLAVSSFALLMACNNNDSTTTDSTMDSMTTTSTTATTDNMSSTSGDGAMPVYYNLETNQPVQVMEDEKTHHYVDVSTHQPVSYYYEPISRDTFDARGRLVNDALILTDGKYSLDDAKIKSNDNVFKIKTDEWKMKYGKDGDTKMKSDEMKIKDKGDKFKMETDSTKMKIKNGEVKMKDK